MDNGPNVSPDDGVQLEPRLSDRDETFRVRFPRHYSRDGPKQNPNKRQTDEKRATQEDDVFYCVWSVVYLYLGISRISHYFGQFLEILRDSAPDVDIQRPHPPAACLPDQRIPVLSNSALGISAGMKEI
jgi:hypothetical protein